MQHFYERIHGWTDHSLLKLYSSVVEESESDSHFVEIGSWKGRSASYMCVEIINSGKKIKFDCVDPWTGSEEHQKGAQFEDIHVLKGTLYEEFVKNMKPVEYQYNAIKLPSVEAAKLYEDNSLDFVFIDGAHDYDNVRSDVLAWLPKVKPGKLLTGHDWKWPPLQKAVVEIFGNEVQEYGTCWKYVKK